MFTTPCDYGMTWSGSACTGSQQILPWNDGSSNWTETEATSFSDGPGNTSMLVNQNSNSTSGRLSPYEAADACAGLSYGGHSDWYLPALNELNTLYNNQGAIGNFTAGGDTYWTSSDSSTGVTDSALYLYFGNDGTGGASKNSLFPLRCVRSGVYTSAINSDMNDDAQQVNNRLINWNPVADAAVSTFTTSGLPNIEQVYGFSSAGGTATEAVSISGGGTPQYQICGDSGCDDVIVPWTSSAGTIKDGQWIEVGLNHVRLRTPPHSPPRSPSAVIPRPSASRRQPA